MLTVKNAADSQITKLEINGLCIWDFSLIKKKSKLVSPSLVQLITLELLLSLKILKKSLLTS